MIKKNTHYTNSYIRPNHTHQELLSTQDIKDKLKDYKKIDNIENIPIGTHIRYFTKANKTETPKFRLGGFLHKLDPEHRYITLNNGNISWSVQLASSILYQKMTEYEIKQELKNEIKKEILTEENIQSGGGTKNQLKLEIKQLTDQIKDFKIIEDNYNSLMKEYNILLKNNEFLKNKISQIEEEIKKNKTQK